MIALDELASQLTAALNPFGLLTFTFCCVGVIVALPLLAVLGYMSAPFGKSLVGRCGSVVHVTVMFALLGLEVYVFQVLCWPGWTWVILGDIAAALTACSFLRTAWTDPGTSSCVEWQAWTKTSQATNAQKTDQPATPQEDAAVEQCFLGGQPWCSRSPDSFEEVRLLTKRHQRSWAPGEVTLCARCNELRPERAHHCRYCGVCSLRLDHHCALVGNCIGWRNHKYFMNLLWWQFWSCFIFLAAPSGPTARVLDTGLSISAIGGVCLQQVAVALAGVMVCISFKSLVDTLRSAARNETCIEANYGGDNPYAQGRSYLHNLEQVLGILDLRLFLPLEPLRRGASCGTSFAVLPPDEAASEKVV